MDERERQLERLRTLHASGALTDAEFELEAANLAQSTPPPIAPSPPVEPHPPLPPHPPAGPRRFNPWLIVAPVAAIAIAVLVYFLVAGRDEQNVAAVSNGEQGNTPAPAPAAAPGTPSMRDRPEAEQLAAAFRAVFGRDGPVPRDLGGEGGTERAARLLWTSFGPVLLTESSLPDGCHVCAGYVGVYYLSDTGSGFEVASRHPEAAPGSSWGSAPEGWTIVDNFTTYPAIYYEGGYTGQGNTSLFAHLVELRPTGPVDSTIDLGYDNSGAVGDDSATGYEGEIRNVVKDQGFEVVYTGTCEFTRRYVLRGETYQPETDAVPECAS